MKEVYEENRRVQRPDLTPAEFWRQVRFDALESDSVPVENLGKGLYRVKGGAERPARLRHGGRFYGRIQGWADRPHQTRQKEGTPAAGSPARYAKAGRRRNPRG